MAIAIRQSINKLRAIQVQSFFVHRAISMSAKLRAEEAIEEMKKKNPYFEKYATKISTLQQTAPEEFLNRLESVEKKTIPKKKEEKQRYILNFDLFFSGLDSYSIFFISAITRNY